MEAKEFNFNAKPQKKGMSQSAKVAVATAGGIVAGTGVAAAAGVAAKLLSNDDEDVNPEEEVVVNNTGGGVSQTVEQAEPEEEVSEPVELELIDNPDVVVEELIAEEPVKPDGPVEIEPQLENDIVEVLVEPEDIVDPEVIIEPDIDVDPSLAIADIEPDMESNAYIEGEGEIPTYPEIPNDYMEPDVEPDPYMEPESLTDIDMDPIAEEPDILADI